jgi:hypothetical protein
MPVNDDSLFFNPKHMDPPAENRSGKKFFSRRLRNAQESSNFCPQGGIADWFN